ncbi:MAG: hypothetical protein F6K40_18180 [Okeania sp. SIO3I5]|uniref:hypothetical protein n=1 Tax=Okeania sp. SIO3I5 TaxID=2607805 RepID=UPI0013BE6086|nr:hypothetical protein [Okeania sp. SIO3I5]NEQ38085.1 hypothetical protein [Okeania sp. SIO3I5]
MITINLKPEIEVQIREKAKSQDLSIEKYIESLIEKEVTDVGDYRQSKVSIDEWEKKLFKFINSPLNYCLSVLPDEAISRENIYTREDEIL